VTQANNEWLAEQFEGNRGHLRAVAYRMLGAAGEADDAVQEAWLRLDCNGADGIHNLRAWLTTVVARVCLDMLRARAPRREEGVEDPPLPPDTAAAPDPEQEALLAESVGLAMLVVLDRLSPAERVAFILHDTFALPFEEIAAVLGRSPAAARQLASRARRAVRGAGAAPADLAEKRNVVEAFLAALRAGDVQGLIAVLAPDVVVHADAAATGSGAAREIRGAANWARGAVAFARHARFVSPALVDDEAALVWAPRGRLQRVVRFAITAGRISAAEIIADPARLRAMNVSMM
jgi:RNA polymerase sigma-70 factor (ECF subfamily)